MARAAGARAVKKLIEWGINNKADEMCSPANNLIRIPRHVSPHRLYVTKEKANYVTEPVTIE
jgi:hypothetical protein